MNGKKKLGKGKVALFIGRFQPFHKGHLFMVKNILKRFDELVIGIGSAQYGNQPRNPFTCAEREEMLRRALAREGIKDFIIVPIDDLHNNALWVSHIEKLVPRFDAVFTHDDLTVRLFREKGYEVVNADLLERPKYSGTEVRKRMVEGGDWKALVPEEVADYIEAIDGPKRVRALA